MKKAVLVVEDEEMLIEVLGTAIESEGLKVYRARNGVEGLRILENASDVGAVLSDVQMPKMNGEELRKKAIELPDHLQPEGWFALTAYLPNEAPQGSLNFFNETFYKPFSPKMIAITIKKFLSRDK